MTYDTIRQCNSIRSNAGFFLRWLLIGILLLQAFMFGLTFVHPAEAWSGKPSKGHCGEETYLKSTGGKSRATGTGIGGVRACVWNVDSSTIFMCGIYTGAGISCQWIIKS